MINSAIERYCDLITTDFHPGIKIIKDVAAGAVLVASITSLIIGLIIFIPALGSVFKFFKMSFSKKIIIPLALHFPY
jgi:hypothetical protein